MSGRIILTGLLMALTLVSGTVKNNVNMGNIGETSIEGITCVKEIDFTDEPFCPDSLEKAMLDEVNIARKAYEKNTVVMSFDLNECARIRAREIAVSFSHTRPDGRTFNTVLSDNGVAFKNWGENVGRGQTCLSDVMSDWMNSEGHKSNILSSQYSFTKFGCAHEVIEGVDYWVQIFISD